MRCKLFYLIVLIALFSLNSFAQDPNRDQKVGALVSQLYQNPWRGAGIIGESPMMWDFSLTGPMKNILEIGSPAQDILLENIKNDEIKDQVMFLLGGVGDKNVIEPIIDAMVPQAEFSKTPNVKKINHSANVALTNITGADVIWNFGGIIIEKCTDNARECWETWWKRNRVGFNPKPIEQRRLYSGGAALKSR